MQSYDHQTIETSVQKTWADQNSYQVHEDEQKKKFYACSMLPYPSGKLHMGHVRNYAINDALTRYLRMQGFNVLMPMGWDAFGLPAENAAKKNHLPPRRWTYDNIAYMKKQMQSMGLAIDWSREFATCDPQYYRWNQWLFLQMLKKGIAYRKTQVVNWDPIDQTVLANEQVIDGKGWRTGATIEKREIPGYYLRISDYAQDLLDGVTKPDSPDYLKGWPERVRAMQANWIGKSTGVRFAFTHTICDTQGQLIQKGKMYVFTTRADTIMGVTFCAIAPEHPLATYAAQQQPAIATFIKACKTEGNTEAEIATKTKKGIFSGLYVTHPLTNQAIPLWIGNYVLMSYGDGAVMGVPAHDERDFAFALKYGLPIKQVIKPVDTTPHQPFHDKVWQDWYGLKKGVCIHSEALDGLSSQAAIKKVTELLKAKNLGQQETTWRLRDWGISRQRYWGTPIPIIHCKDCGIVPVPEKDLPVRLPENLIPDGRGNPLEHHEAFIHVNCPQCGKPARRETDTMDTFVDSSWYFIRYCDPQNQKEMVSSSTVDYWLPMDQYIGGIEHAILHLLYARFWTRVLYDLSLVKVKEPFTRLLTQGMVLNHIYSYKNKQGAKQYCWPHEVENLTDNSGKITGAKLKTDVDRLLPKDTEITYEGIGTMSKSKNNGVDPQHLIKEYGADTARLYTLFTAPPEASLEWKGTAVEGSYRFLRRVWSFAKTYQNVLSSPFSKIESKDQGIKDLRYEVHTILAQANHDYERMQYNTVVSACMKILNALEQATPKLVKDQNNQYIISECFSIFIRVLYPICPHLTYHLWKELGYLTHYGDLLDTDWPQVDRKAVERNHIEMMLQINGKLRGAIQVATNADRALIEATALHTEASKKYIGNAKPKKIIIVPGRLINIVC
jgi:leucyl-tRNA synthetase